MVKQNIFERIEVSFLIVGHTHNDVDRIFSLISRKIFPCVIHNLNLLKELILDAGANLEQDKVSYLWLKKRNRRKRKKKKEKRKKKKKKKKKKKVEKKVDKGKRQNEIKKKKKIKKDLFFFFF